MNIFPQVAPRQDLSTSVPPKVTGLRRQSPYQSQGPERLGCGQTIHLLWCIIWKSLGNTDVGRWWKGHGEELESWAGSTVPRAVGAMQGGAWIWIPLSAV